MNVSTHIVNFIQRHENVSNNHGRPCWIKCTWSRLAPGGESVHSMYSRFDFKNDDARKAFGALCHIIYTSAEVWQITTEREQ